MSNATKPLCPVIAEFCQRLKFNDLPKEVVRAAKDHLLDALGVGLASASLSSTQGLKNAVARLGSGTEATALGFGERFPAPSAALFNGTLIHSLEYDDTHISSVMHGSSAIVPAALAVAESAGASGRELLRAVVIGWELLIRMGLAAPGLFQGAGFQTTAVCAPLATAALASALLGLNEIQTIGAMGIAGSQASGIFEFLSDGSTVKSLHPGWAAHSGVIAAYLSQGGMTGPATILEGKFGLYRTFAHSDSGGPKLAQLLTDLGRTYHLPQASFKAYACCHYIHSFLECLEQLTEDGLVADQVESIHCWVPTEEAPIICDPWERRLNPTSGYEAKFSLPYCLAALLVDKAVSVSTFDRPQPDPAALALVGRLSYEPLADSGFPERFPGRLEVTLKDGRRLETSVDDVKGSPGRPMTSIEVRAKFEANAQRRLTPAAVAETAAVVADLDEMDNLERLSTAIGSVIE